MNTDTQNTLPAQLRLAAEIIEKNLPWEHRFNETPWFTNADLAAPHILVARGHEIRLAQPTTPQPPEGFHLATDEEKSKMPTGSKVWIEANSKWIDSTFIGDDLSKAFQSYACPNTETPLGSDIALEPFIHPGSFDAGHADALYLVEQPTYGGPPPALVQSRKEFAAAIEAIEQPWITHDGGDNPIPGQANGMFEYKLLDNSTAKDASSDQLRWHHIGGPSDIIAYRVTKAKPPVQPAGKSILNIVQGIVSERMRFTLDVPTLHAVIEAVRADRQPEVDRLNQSIALLDAKIVSERDYATKNREAYDREVLNSIKLREAKEAAETALKKSEEEHTKQKTRADQHWETLRGIRDIAKLHGDLPRIIQWVDEAGSGYVETAEKSHAVLMDEINAGKARISDLERHLAQETANGDCIMECRHLMESNGVPRKSFFTDMVTWLLKECAHQTDMAAQATIHPTLRTIPDDETLSAWAEEHGEDPECSDFSTVKFAITRFLSHTQAEAKEEPKTFTGPDGKEYFPYSIGDPMPCDGYAKIEIVCIDGRTAQEDGVKYLPRTAHSNIWEKTKGWRYADTAPEEKPQVALEASDVPPGSAFRQAHFNLGVWETQVSQNTNGIISANGNGELEMLSWDELFRKYQINRSIPLTGRWNPEAWEPCSKNASQPNK